jgi:hypothetical protein
VLYLAGTSQERGFTEGYLCATEIQSLITGFALQNKLIRSPLMWEHLVLPLVKKRIQIPERTHARLAALLEGMRTRDPRSLRLDALQRDLTVDDLVAATAIPDWIGLMCSSFAIWSDTAESAPTLVGRNLDYFGTQALTDNLMLIVQAPDGERRGWVSFGYPGMGGCVTGISDRGLFVAIHDVVSFARKESMFTPRLVALQEVLETVDPTVSTTVSADAAKILRVFDFGMGGNCLVAWRGGAAVMEFDGRRSQEDGVTVRAADGTFIACSNHFRSRGVARHCRRYQSLDQELHSGRPGDLDQASEVIRLASKSDTLYRLVTDLQTTEVRLERKKSPGGKWHSEVRFTASELLRDAGSLQSADTERPKSEPPAPSPSSGAGKKEREFYSREPIGSGSSR